MSIKIVRTKSRCKECPLDGAVRNKVHGQCDAERPEIAFIGEAPGADEDLKGVPFVGQAGWLFKNAVTDTGHLWHKAHKTNAICCRPPNNKIESVEAQTAIDCCRAGFFEELYALYKRGVKVFVPVGATATAAFGITESITRIRGSVTPMRWRMADFFIDGVKDVMVLEPSDGAYDILCVPSFHPAFISYSKDPRHQVTFINDLDKAYELTKKRYVPPAENFNIYPTVLEIEDRARSAVENANLLAVDLETSGFVPGHAAIIVTGIAETGERAFSIPFLKEGGKQNFDPDDKARSLAQLKIMMEECDTIFQNALFDARHLMYLGCEPKRIKHDTMILHHCLNPELPHNLGYITSVYGRTPYWKGEMIDSMKALIKAPDKDLRTYNLRDCVVLHQVLGPMLEDAKESGVLYVYENIAMPLVPAVLHMIENGILVDTAALRKWRIKLKRKKKRLYEKLLELARVPEDFNFNSGDHMRYLIFGIIPKQWTTAVEKMKAYTDDPKKNRNTKAYRQLLERVELFNAVVPFRRLRHTPKKTESGNISIDDEALLNVQVAANNRLAEIGRLRRLTPKHSAEKAELLRLTDLLTTYREYRANEKLLTTYTSFPLGKDNRLRAPYRITGTNTGRLSSGNKKEGEAGNMQNIPPEAKHLFVAPEGSLFIQFDYSNLELRVMAEISDDDVLRDIFARGLNVHTENCKMMFQIDEDHPLWKAARRACKTYIFGRNYGGGLKGIHARLVKAVPELNLTYERFCEIDQTYRNAHPQYDRWRNAVIREVQATRRLENAFGRVRYFLGRPDEIIREGLNFPIQSCLMPETKILTKEGWKEIQHFAGGEVWTGEKWAYADVITAKGKRTKLYLSDGTYFLCDDNHKLLVENGPWPKWCSVLEITGKTLIEDHNEEFGTAKGEVTQWYWAGRMMGDGYVKNDGSWGIAFNTTTKRKAQEDFIDWLVKQPELSPEIPYKSYKNGYTSEPGKKVSLYAENTRAIWKRWGFMPGVGARNKTVPDVIFTLDRESRMAFLSGWYDADGTVVKESSRGGVLFNGRRISRITSASPKAVQSGIKLAKTLGLNARAAQEYNKKGLTWGGILFTQGKRPLVVENVCVSSEWETTYTLSVQDERHAYSSEGLISKNTAADIINLAMIELERMMNEGELQAKLVGQVHDSLLFEVPKSTYKREGKKIKDVMEKPVKIGKRKVVFPVDAEVGQNWGSLEELKV